MRQIVLGVYDSYADACSAQRALGEAGIAQADIAVYSMSVEVPAEKGPRVYAPGGGDAHHHQPVFDQLENLFARLFKRGEYPPETEDYREFIRRGGALVSTDVPEMQVDLARDVMRRAGAADIDERSHAWRNGSTPGAAFPAAGASESPRQAGAASESTAPPPAFSSAVQTTPGGMQQVTTRTSGQPAAQSDDAFTATAEQTSGRGLVGHRVMGKPRDELSCDTEFRKDYDANYANTGASYEDYRPAYEHGAMLGQDERYRGHDWHGVETGAREDWESRYPESGWERFKAAVRHGWERVTGQ